MAVTAVTTSTAGAINYTFTTDTSADFASVANSTYFYNIADKLVRYKDGTGAILEIFSASGGASGVWGISNASGVYTYYTTLTLAMVAAVSGNVIEMFADVTETGAVTVTLKDGVNINGNGHTYTLNTSTTTNGFIDNGVGVIMLFSNITLIKKGTGAGIMIALSVAGNRIVGNSTFIKIESNSSTGIGVYGGAVFSGNINGFTINCTGTSCYGINLVRGYIDSCNVISTGEGISLTIGTITNSYGESTGAGNGIAIGGSGYISNCSGKSNTGYGLSSGASIYNSTGYSAGSFGIFYPNGLLANCVGVSAASYGIYGYGEKVNNCTAISSGGYGIFAQNAILNNCVSFSAVGYALVMFNATIANNSTFTTSSGTSTIIADNATGNASVKNCVIVNDWNNASGNGINSVSVLVVNNCSIKVANASAKAIYSASAITMKYANNNFEGSTNPISTTITQGIVNTFDNQGNILI
jgi:hypothetical protein